MAKFLFNPITGQLDQAGVGTLTIGTSAGTVAEGNDARLSDSRTPVSHAASHAAGVRASYDGQVDGMTENVFIRANNMGTAGNSITLSFDGVDNIATVLAAWNSANPSNQATLISGSGSQVPTTGESIILANGVNSGSDPVYNQDLNTSNGVEFDTLIISGSNIDNSKITLSNENGNTIDFGTQELTFQHTGGSDTPYISVTDGLNNEALLGLRQGEMFLQGSNPVVRIEQGGGGLADIKVRSVIVEDDVNSYLGTFRATNEILSNDRTYDLPDASGTLALISNFAAPPAIGNTTRNTGAFTTLNANNGTITASAPVLDLAQTWNNAAVTFTGLRFNVTNTASAAASLLADFQVGGTSIVNISRDGFIGSANAGITVRATGSFNRLSFFSQGATRLLHNNNILLNESDGGYGWVTSGAPTSLSFDTGIFRGAAGTIDQRNGTNPQTFRLYNTFTDANNHERGFMRWSSNVLQIGTERAGTGSVRSLEFVGPNNARILLSTAGNGTVLMGGGNTTEASMQLTRDRMILDEDTPLEWSGDGFRVDQGVSTTGTAIRKDGSSSLAVRNGTNAQTFRIYNTWTSATNFDRVNFRWASNEFIIDAEAGSGGGTLRGIKIGSATSSLLGFYGATPVDRPNDVTMSWDSDGTQGTVNNAEDTEARQALFEIRARLRELGLIATT